jgi:VWFA-related protein
MWFRWFALTIAAAAQEAPPIRVTVRLVQVDAVVTDAKGQRVTGLARDDFEIRQNGKERPVTAFAYVPEHTADVPLVSGPVKPSEVKRTIAIVVDDLALSFSSTVRVRDAIKKYAASAMRRGDLVSLIRTGGGVAVLEQFTTDPRHLLAAAELLKWRYAGRTGIKPIDPLDDPTPARNGPQVLDHDMGLHEIGAIATLDNVLTGLRKLPGRKSIVYISDALNMQFHTSASLDRIVDKANRAAVSVYSIDPRGLKTKMPDASQDRPDRLFDSLGDALGVAAYGDSEGLHYLANRTGGVFFGDNDIPSAIERAAKDQLGYYLLGFSPAEATFEDAIKPRFHKVTVRLKRPGLRVRWKSGFLGALDDQPVELSATGEKSREQELLEALASPFRADSLHVRLTSSFVHSTQHGQGVISQLHFDAKQLSFHRGLDGFWSAKVDIVTSAYRGAKHPLRQRERVENIRLPDEIYQKSLREGFLFQFFDPIPEPGFFMLRAVVRDSESRKIGSASQVVEVPDARKNKLAMSGIGVRLLPPGVEGVPAEPGFSTDVQPWADGNPAVRRFKPGQDVLYAFSVINPRPAMTTQLKVYRNGSLVFTGGQLALVNGGMIDAAHHAGGGVIRLGAKFPPGEYLAQVTLFDPKAKKRAPRPSQWIDFEVVAAR